jgi:hypothetical protein
LLDKFLQTCIDKLKHSRSRLFSPQASPVDLPLREAEFSRHELDLVVDFLQHYFAEPTNNKTDRFSKLLSSDFLDPLFVTAKLTREAKGDFIILMCRLVCRVF